MNMHEMTESQKANLLIGAIEDLIIIRKNCSDERLRHQLIQPIRRLETVRMGRFPDYDVIKEYEEDLP